MIVRAACQISTKFIGQPFRPFVHNSRASECFRQTVKIPSLSPSIGKARAYSNAEEDADERFIDVVLALLALPACGIALYRWARVETENKELQKQVDALQKELDTLRSAHE